MPVSVILITLRKSSRFRDALSKVGQNNIKSNDHTIKSALGKRMEPEKEIPITRVALIK